MNDKSSWGARSLVLLGVLAASLGATAGCGDHDDAPATGGKGGTGGGGGGTGGSKAATGGAGGDTGGASVDVGGSGGAGSCDCGDDVNGARIPLACACAAAMCTTFEEDLVKYQSGGRFGEPYYVLLGTCAAGYRTLSFEEALEQGGRRTFDAQGRMVYDQFGGYDGYVPESCGFDERFSLGSVTIGDDPSKSCTYCLLAGNDAGMGGAGGAGTEPAYPESLTPPCEASLLE